MSKFISRWAENMGMLIFGVLCYAVLGATIVAGAISVYEAFIATQMPPNATLTTIMEAAPLGRYNPLALFLLWIAILVAFYTWMGEDDK